MVAVLGLSESSRADLNAQLDALGTNLLVVQPGQDMLGDDATLPESSVDMIARVPTVETAAATYAVDASVRKSDLVPAAQTSGIVVAAAGPGLDTAVSAELREGRWLDAATGDYPAVVLGSTAARRLAVGSLDEGVRVWLDGQWFAVIGVLEPVVLAPELDATALIGVPVAEQLYGDGERLPPTTVYTRVDTDQVAATRALLGRTANPSAPTEVSVSASVGRPGGTGRRRRVAHHADPRPRRRGPARRRGRHRQRHGHLGARAAARDRRTPRARRHPGRDRQPVPHRVGAALAAGWAGRRGAGVAVTTAFAVHQGWGVVLPWQPVLAGLGCSLLVGTVVGMYPALRAASVPPTEALRAI